MRYDHLTMLPNIAFKAIGKRMTLEGDKGGSPDVPDFKGAAEATAKGNLEAARVAAKANRVSQYTPYGNLVYEQANQSGFDQAGYDAALKDYQQKLAQYQATGGANPSSGFAGSALGAGGSKPVPMAPNRDSYIINSDPDVWKATQTLSPAEQAKLDKNNELSLSMLDTGITGLKDVNKYLSEGFDWSKLPEAQINAGQTAQDAIMARLNPQFAQSEESLRTRLINQGVRPGSQAWDNEFRNFSQGKNDAYSQAALQGIDVGQKARQQAIQEQEFGRTEGLNIVNALRTGNQVQQPNFINTPQQATTAGPDLLGAAQAQYSGELGASNAQNAAGAGLFSGLANTAGTIGSAYFL